MRRNQSILDLGSGIMKNIRIFVGFILALSTSGKASPCVLDLDSRSGKNPPLLTKDGGFVYPDGSRIIEFGEGSKFIATCHGSGFLGAFAGEDLVNLICESGSFKDIVTKSNVNVKDLDCSDKVEPEIRIKHDSSCAQVGFDQREEILTDLTTVQIGWNIGNSFLDQIHLCVDEKFYATLWTRHIVHGKSIDFRDITSGRPSFRRDIDGQDRLFHNFPTQTAIEESYTKSSQVVQMQTLLGSNIGSHGEEMIDEDRGSRYFARGHLSPDAAFIYDALQDATYFFVNVAPQFQTFNNGNWKALEGAVRDYAASVKEAITVFTGTFDFLTYPDEAGVDQPIFLYTTDGHKWIPAPKYYWKVVHNIETDEAIAFVGLNDAHATDPPELLCESQCKGLSWVDWSIESLDSGFMYCCSVEDLRKAIPYVPDLCGPDHCPTLMQDTQQPTEPPVIPEGTCTLDVDKVSAANPPILMRNDDFLLPEEVDKETGHRVIRVYDGEQFTAVCHGTKFNSASVVGYDNAEVSFTCQQGILVDVNANEVDFTTLDCSRLQEPMINVTFNVQCATEGLNGRSVKPEDLARIDIGWMIGGKFRPQIQICQDQDNYASLWTHHVVKGKSIGFRDTAGGRPLFRRDVRDQPDNIFFKDFVYDYMLDDAYSKDSQVSMMNKILGANEINGEKLIDDASSSTTYFAKGHLSPDAAFVTQAFQDATYYFMNVAPQYQSFNGGNWKALEGSVRDYAQRTGCDIDVYTGTYGNLYYKDVGGTNRKIYLAENSNGDKLLEPPKYYWKVVHNKESNEAIAFVGVNDAHSTSTYTMCSDVCDSLPWADWDMDNLSSGFMYCCEVSELRQAIEYVPDLRDTNGHWPSLMTK